MQAEINPADLERYGPLGVAVITAITVIAKPEILLAGFRRIGGWLEAIGSLFAWVVRSIVDACIRRFESNTRVNEELALRLQQDQDGVDPKSGHTSPVKTSGLHRSIPLEPPSVDPDEESEEAGEAGAAQDY